VQRKLLLVDDEVGILRALRRLFRRAGYEILMAESAEEALEQFAKNDMPVILTDFRMPGADGGALLQRIAQVDPTSVGLVLSGFAELKQVIGAFESGAVHRFISKPWVDTDLLEQVERAFVVARQKRCDIELENLPLEAGADLPPSLLEPLSFIHSLHITESETTNLFAIEFVCPRILLSESKLDASTALSTLVVELLETLPAGTKCCHWSGYTLLLQADAHAAPLIMSLLETRNDRLRWASASVDDRSNSELISELLIELAHTEIESDIFSGSDLNFLQDTPLCETIVDAVNNAAFSVVFQPILASSGGLQSLEALLRCPDIPESKVSLDELIRFIDLLGFTEKFTRMQFNTAMAEFAGLKLDSGVKLVLNLSARQCSWPKLIETLEQSAIDSGLGLERLSLDVSEVALRSRVPTCRANLTRLRSMVSELTLDDQGAAHAYLNSEEIMSVSCVKLDRAFLHELDSYTNRQEMLVNLCDRILERGKKLSFEGVENQQQLNFLNERYSFSYQGFSLAKPMNRCELEDWLAAKGEA